MPPADWLTPLLDGARQRALDQWAIEEVGIPGLQLMERAGTGLAELVMERAPTGRVSIVCGKGNNGGDGLVCASFLRQRGRDVDVLLLAPGEELRGDARTNLERLPGDPPQPFAAATLQGATAIVDAILGTGFRGEAHGDAAAAIDAVNDAGARQVIACDVPSGVDGSTGEVAGSAVRADATATFNAPKPGLWIAPGKAHAGEVRVIDIGIPAGGPGERDGEGADAAGIGLADASGIGLIDQSVIREIPRRGRESTKFAAGSVLVCGGSTGLTGAPCMASEAAMRAGAGYVTACIPGSLNAVFESRLLEVMTVPLPDSGGSLHPDGLQTVLERAQRVDALILGPGLGREAGAFELARGLAAAVEVPLLLDADGLNAHAGRLDALSQRRAPTVLTPHAGELGRLLESDSGTVSARRLHSVREAAARAQAVVVLKGDDTLVAEPGGLVAVSRGGASGLATAGTGDVLSGMIGAYLAKRVEPFTAACAAVLAHARAGQLTADSVGPEGVIASDVIAMIPGALRVLSEPER